MSRPIEFTYLDRCHDNPFVGPVAEDDRGDLWLPAWTLKGYWNRRLDLRRPTHWLPWLRMRLTNKVAWIELWDWRAR